MVGLDNHTRWNMSGGGGTIVNVSPIRQPWYGPGRKTVVKKAKDVRMQWTGCGDFRNDVCETLCHAQTPNWETVKNHKHRKKRAKKIATATVQLCGDNNLAEKWINGQCAMEKVQRQNWLSSKNVAFLGGRGVERISGRKLTTAKHLCTEHNQEAGHVTNLGAERKSKIMKGSTALRNGKRCEEDGVEVKKAFGL